MALPVNRGNLHETLAIVASGLQTGEQTRRILCPACGGGHTAEKSFALRKEQDCIKYKCWRASCGVKGIIDYFGSFLEEPQAPPPPADFKGRHFLGSLSEIPLAGRSMFKQRFGLEDNDLEFAGVRWAPESDRYSFPVENPRGVNKGLTLRTFHEHSIHPKWEAFPNYKDVCWQGWYVRSWTRKMPVVVVEDALSALKVSRQYRAAFLNGTDINLDKMSEMIGEAGDAGVIIALDKDASEKAINLLQKYSFFLGGMATCVQLEVDLKFFSDSQIKNLFSPLVKAEG
jgi:hypothetical protein